MRSRSSGDIAVSVAVRELCVGKPFRFEDHGQLMLKGMPEPTQTYAVSWHESGLVGHPSHPLGIGKWRSVQSDTPCDLDRPLTDRWLVRLLRLR